MKKLFTSLLLLSLTACGKPDQATCLKKVLCNIEKIESASYRSFGESYAPGDTIPNTQVEFVREFANPADTTIGASCLHFGIDDTTRCVFGYDGLSSVSVDSVRKKVLIDDFTIRRAPFRMVPPPFFNYTGSIIRYALTTRDSIETQFEQSGQEYRFRLVINEDKQVEFFGKPHYIPTNNLWSPVSIYKIWIRKADMLPYKIRREMAQDISVTTVSEVRIDRKPETELRLSDYYPADYEVVMYGQHKKEKNEFDLTGSKAPEWTLRDADGNPVSLGDFTSKVLLINFTGIGCGACYQAIPFLNGLKGNFSAADLELAAIETWGKRGHSIQAYTDHNKLKYILLEGTTEVFEDYASEKAVPIFILLDEHRIIRHIFKGYGRTSDAQITEAIERLLDR